ncbi:hypothetical protein HDV57DRAFT_307328 [Trichoderma longibrachiatum]
MAGHDSSLFVACMRSRAARTGAREARRWCRWERRNEEQTVELKHFSFAKCRELHSERAVEIPIQSLVVVRRKEDEAPHTACGMTSYAMGSSSSIWPSHVGPLLPIPCHPSHHGQLRSFMQPSNSFLSPLFFLLCCLSLQSFRASWRAEPASLVSFPAVDTPRKFHSFFVFLQKITAERFPPLLVPKTPRQKPSRNHSIDSAIARRRWRRRP